MFLKLGCTFNSDGMVARSEDTSVSIYEFDCHVSRESEEAFWKSFWGAPEWVQTEGLKRYLELLEVLKWQCYCHVD
jgi:hypothetical protein